MDVHSGFFGVTADPLVRRTRPTWRSRTTRASISSAPGSIPDAGKVFCLAIGPSRESIMRIHERAGHPTPEIYELTDRGLNDATTTIPDHGGGAGRIAIIGLGMALTASAKTGPAVDRPQR